jgi:predicted Zn finger-like uncharacterized protein
MSLATRCTACGTVFRVVQDQLRVSSGWVRCGRCGEVFNAIESLVDMGAEGRSEPSSPSAHASRVMETLARVAGTSLTPAPEHEDLAPGVDRVEPVPQATAMPVDAPVSTDARRAGDGDVGGVGVTRAGPVSDVEARRVAATPDDGTDMPATNDGATADDVFPSPMLAASPEAPRFVRLAEQQALWRRPAVRALMASACAVLAVLLGWQVHFDRHDGLVAQWPGLRPLSLRLCELQGCTIEPQRRLEALVVEASGLTKAEAAGIYRLALTIHNRSDVVARMPAVDLVLSDATGRPMVRRVLGLDELGLQDDALEPAARAHVATRLRVEPPAVVGYTIELFYP